MPIAWVHTEDDRVVDYALENSRAGVVKSAATKLCEDNAAVIEPAEFDQHTRVLLLDIHAVLDHLYLDGTRPQATSPAEDYLRESASPYTLPGLITALDEVINTIYHAGNDAFGCTPAPEPPAPATTSDF